MMNKKRSNGIGRTKYLIFIPLAAFLMLLSNIEAVARITGEIAADAVAEVKEATELTLVADNGVKVTGQVIDDSNEPISGANVLVKGTTIGTITDLQGKFSLETTKDAVLAFSFLGHKTKEVAVKDVLGNLKVQLYPDGTVKRDPSKQVFTIVEVMPEFPGGQDALLKYLATNIKYPVIAQENGIQGRVGVSFIIETDGSIRNIEVIRGVDPSLDKEAMRVVSNMPKWTPGKQRGIDVAVKYTVPITFRLQGKGNANPPSDSEDDEGIMVVGYGPSKEADAKETTATTDRVFTVVQDMPKFPGGQDALLEYLAKTIQYPQIAKENGIKGRVTCSFIVNKDGSISNAEVIRGVDPSLDKEALRVINTMPNWIPAKQGGKVVRVRYTVPVTFNL